MKDSGTSGTVSTGTTERMGVSKKKFSGLSLLSLLSFLSLFITFTFIAFIAFAFQDLSLLLLLSLFITFTFSGFITFDYESHKKLSDRNIRHKLIDDYITDLDRREIFDFSNRC